MTTPDEKAREAARYYATTHTVKGTLLSQAAEDTLCTAFLELDAAHTALGREHAGLVAAHEMQDQALDEALRQRDGLRRELAKYRRETGGEG